LLPVLLNLVTSVYQYRFEVQIVIVLHENCTLQNVNPDIN